ncbi:hypothetical protein MMC10_009713 [Thelotrema lepadinum]|nr:hypothetical protein [Thelotrema lepadinum]
MPGDTAKRVTVDGLLSLIANGETPCHVYFVTVGVKVANMWMSHGPYTEPQLGINRVLSTIHGVNRHSVFNFYEGLNEWLSGEVPFLDLPLPIKSDSGSIEPHAIRITFAKEHNPAVRAKLPAPVYTLLESRHTLEAIAKWMQTHQGSGPEGVSDNKISGSYVSAAAARKAVDEKEKSIREQETGNVSKMRMQGSKDEHYIVMTKNGAYSFVIAITPKA